MTEKILNLTAGPGAAYEIDVHQSGSGPDLLFLHGAGGLFADDPFLAALSRHFRVHAPRLPGYGRSSGDTHLRDMIDFTLLGWDIADALELHKPLLVGHSMGGMIAAEMAAIAPDRVERLALLCPAGLWMDSHPVTDIFAALPFEFPSLLLHDPVKHGALLSAGGDFDDAEFLTGFLVENSRRLTTAGKLLFPVPDRGLGSRLYRVKARTQVLWGNSDKLIDPAYAAEFTRLMPNAQSILIDAAGHMLPYEQTEKVINALIGLHN
ncbi:MAG: alpha/beta fold hydrolase [Gammaproteobacteria bacterium]|nr:alpha/beta fold hydrolase [Gammaproteobacteria bacterium]